MIVIADVASRFALLKNGKIAFNLSMHELEERAKTINMASVKEYLEHEMITNNDKETLSFFKQKVDA